MNALPRWRGFNLLERFSVNSAGQFRETDLQWIAEWGFDFVRIPMDYRLWADNDQALAPLDQLIEWAGKYGLHVNLNFHRTPGYCVNRNTPAVANLWRDAAPQAEFCRYWALFAKRYRGLNSDRLSFNLINEPTRENEWMTRAEHDNVIRAAVAAIRAVDPTRLLIVDGLTWGNEPLPELADLGVAQSCRAYWPMGISHYHATWVSGINEWKPPVWPGGDHQGQPMTRADVAAHYARWAALTEKGIGVHCGEGGAWKMTPHPVVLAWLRDVLEILAHHQIGWALWNFRGNFGILDSDRADVAYEEFRGHRLDRALLDLLRAS
jgi:endoglucanase